MPVLFLGHGSPMNAIEENEFTEGWRNAARTIPRPTAVLCISAHWETDGSFVTAMEHPQTIHDFGGFPAPLYDVQYPAPGDASLAHEVRAIVKSTEIRLDDEWGLDHGCWSVMRHMYPDADIPIVQLSLDVRKTPQEQYALGRALAPLRERGILIVGSGNIVHNLGLVAWEKINTQYGYDWALEAKEQINACIADRGHERLLAYASQGESWNLAIPSPEHFLPLLYVLALQKDDEEASIFNDKAVAGSLTMTSLRIG